MLDLLCGVGMLTVKNNLPSSADSNSNETAFSDVPDGRAALMVWLLWLGMEYQPDTSRSVIMLTQNTYSAIKWTGVNFFSADLSSTIQPQTGQVRHPRPFCLALQLFLESYSTKFDVQKNLLRFFTDFCSNSVFNCAALAKLNALHTVLSFYQTFMFKLDKECKIMFESLIRSLLPYSPVTSTSFFIMNFSSQFFDTMLQLAADGFSAPFIQFDPRQSNSSKSNSNSHSETRDSIASSDQVTSLKDTLL